MKTFILTFLLVLGISVGAQAQITIPNSFTAGTTISSSQVNANFTTLGGDALNRTGGTITGNITVSAAVTIDGVDLSAWLDQSVKVAASPTFSALTLTNGIVVGTTAAIGTSATVGTTLAVNSTGASAIDVAGGAQFGTGDVALIGTDGKINGPLSSTIIDDLSGTNLTGIGLLGSSNTWTSTNIYSGRNDFLNYTETDASPTISGGTLTLDLNTATHFQVALNANITTLAISNAPSSSKVGSFVLAFTADGTLRTVDWADIGVVWAGGVAPTLTSTNNKRDFFTFITYDGGSSWYGFVGGQNF